ncbi:MAG: hypothetical protein CME19_22135 [Gemmatimonadetes bacterium]|nr:hypothetical protein [Gemmatimonadota bacterium]
MLTGQYPQRTGIESALGENEPGLRASERTIASCLRDAGYSTGIIGK